jgi:hypothetical protein
VEGRRLAGIATSVALVLTAAVLASVGGNGESATAPASAPRLVSFEDLVALEEALEHPIYWAGERPGKRIELAEDAEGSVYLRYLPEGVEAGDPRQLYLTVGTYPVVDAAAALRGTAEENGLSLRRLEEGAVLLSNPSSPSSVYVVYGDADLQVEVYDPAPARALGLVEAGAVRPVGG